MSSDISNHEVGIGLDGTQMWLTIRYELIVDGCLRTKITNKIQPYTIQNSPILESRGTFHCAQNIWKKYIESLLAVEIYTLKDAYNPG
jgi:hypothetical protein